MKHPAQILYTPSPEKITRSQMTAFCEFVNQRYQLDLPDYAALYEWSVTQIPQFWAAVWDFMEMRHSTEPEEVVDDLSKMPGAQWFSGARLNFAENLLRYRDDRIAIRFQGEDQITTTLTYAELYEKVAQTAAALKAAGVGPHDRVVGFMPNLPETVIAMLATVSLGAIWSSSSPDFGIKGVLDRFSQIEPKIIFAADGYFYGGKRFDALEKLAGILDKLPTVETVVIVPYTSQPPLDNFHNAVLWNDFLVNDPPEFDFVQLPFNHPLYIMYSSGTTGLPKSIVHSAGGTLIQHLKELRLHTDLTREDTIFYFTTCGWMMWNWLVSSLAVGATVVLYDGNPFYPDASALWKMAEEMGITVFGTSAKYLSALEAAGAKPGRDFNLNSLRAILSTGSPLLEESFDYVYGEIKPDMLLGSISGGTDLISCFALANPVLPVRRDELQCRGLGMKVEAFDETGAAVLNTKGELVCTAPFPSMPVYFWNDPDGEKYRNAYFDQFPNVWRHGDFIEINEHGGVKIFGRSDATLNPGGVRIGTAEIYRVVESFPEIADALVVGQNWNGDERVVLFVKMAGGQPLDSGLASAMRMKIRQNCSPRHVPAKVLAAPDIPYTINGKKVEVAVKQLLHGGEVKNRDALKNPESLDFFRNIPELNCD
ncbi:MAG: acetoacetate--CoA ligase [Candidatus Marinimicrobia bacterium]|nr:acetoacetate--CoA ligase [Candidatus Neomarinimicrobiota bacterium]MCF7840862.1 acetoacetate--CoA ligase [Candidatus Neomarinimicrobiota bacterium]MCF7902811.1 acetoacetate--CoA ligase [Candidatus Neomarinimicrobiota bacterium]